MNKIYSDDLSVSLAARLELLAEVSKLAEQPLRQSPHCLYQDTDSVVMDGTPEAEQEIGRVKNRLNDLYGKHGLPTRNG